MNSLLIDDSGWQIPAKTNIKLLDLFSVPIYVSDNTYKIDDSLLDFIKNLDKSQNPEIYKRAQDEADFGNAISSAWLKIADNQDGSLWNGSSTDKYVLHSPELLGLKDFILGHVNNYAYNILRLKDGIRFYVTQSWVVYNNQMSSSHRHSHPNSVISGVFYIQGNYCPIRFHSGNRTLFPGFEFEVDEYNSYNSTSWDMPNEQFKLILFPSSLEHSVVANESEVQRISLAFNTFIHGNAGMEEALIGLRLDEPSST